MTSRWKALFCHYNLTKYFNFSAPNILNRHEDFAYNDGLRPSVMKKFFKCYVILQRLNLPISKFCETENVAKRYYICNICSKIFGRKKNLNGHTKSVHEKVKCTYCDKIVSRLNKHKKICIILKTLTTGLNVDDKKNPKKNTRKCKLGDSKQKGIICDICKETLSSEILLAKHSCKSLCTNQEFFNYSICKSETNLTEQNLHHTPNNSVNICTNDSYMNP